MKHPTDVTALIGYAASGGFGGLFVLLGFVLPSHQAQFNAAATVTVAVAASIAGALRVLANPTPPSGQQAVFTTSVPPKTATLTTPQQNAETKEP